MSRRIAIAAALGLLAASWAGYFALGTFAAHMVAHVTAVAVAAPLLALTLPRPASLSTVGAALGACALELIVVWGWHLPALHAAARSGAPGFALEQISFLAAGYAVWASALGTSTTSAGAGLAGVAALLLTSMHMSLLGGLLMLVPGDGYLAHDVQGAVQGAAAADRRLGGALMLAAGGISYLSGALVLLRRSLARATNWKNAS